MLSSELYKIMLNKVTFIVLVGAIAPVATLDPSLTPNVHNSLVMIPEFIVINYL